MQLALSDEDAKFRDELRTFFTTEIPAEIRDRACNDELIWPDDIVTTMRIPNKAGLAVPNWPVEWGRQDWSLRSGSSGPTRCGWPPPEPLAFNASMVGPVIAQFGSPGNSRSASCRPRPTRHLVVPGLFRARGRSDLASLGVHRRFATATTTSTTARRPGRRWASSPTGSSCWPAPGPGRPRSRPASRSSCGDVHRHHAAADPLIDGSYEVNEVWFEDVRSRPISWSARRTPAGATPSSCCQRAHRDRPHRHHKVWLSDVKERAAKTTSAADPLADPLFAARVGRDRERAAGTRADQLRVRATRAPASRTRRRRS